MMNIVQSSRQLPYTTYFYDNTDNNDNGKNGRNALCHKVTYNRDNKITVVNSFFSHVIKDQPVRLYLAISCDITRYCLPDSCYTS